MAQVVPCNSGPLNFRNTRMRYLSCVSICSLFCTSGASFAFKIPRAVLTANYMNTRVNRCSTAWATRDASMQLISCRIGAQNSMQSYRQGRKVHIRYGLNLCMRCKLDSLFFEWYDFSGETKWDANFFRKWSLIVSERPYSSKRRLMFEWRDTFRWTSQLPAFSKGREPGIGKRFGLHYVLL